MRKDRDLLSGSRAGPTILASRTESVRRVDRVPRHPRTDRLITELKQRIMGRFIVGIDGGGGPVATGALTRPGGSSLLVAALITYSL